MNRITKKILNGFIPIASLASVAFLWRNNLALTVVLIVLAILMLWMNKSTREIKTFVFCAIFGTISESFAIYFGAWNYANPDFLDIPFWLFILWGIASVFMVRVYLFFK